MDAVQFVTCDVFTDTRFGGNPLAVIPDARGLSSTQMQQIAREFNYSESTFVLPAEQGHTRRVRIFTPTAEIPFAGHPNVGTAFVLASQGLLENFVSDGTTVVTFEEDAGLVPISIDAAGGRVVSCELQAPQPVSISEAVDVELVARSVGLAAHQIETRNHTPKIASVGLPFVIAELTDLAALQQAEPDAATMRAMRQQGMTPDVHVYVRGSGDVDLHARMFAPLDGVPEDPATGSANTALVGLLASLSPQIDGDLSWSIAQGVEMGRPSLLQGRARKVAGQVDATWIGGSSVLVAEGQLHLT